MGGCVSKRKNKSSNQDLRAVDGSNGCCDSLEGGHHDYDNGEPPSEAKYIHPTGSAPDETDQGQQTAGSRNQNVIYSTRTEINLLLMKITEFEGITDKDHNYRYLDEMLTRCILNLDEIECNSSGERTNRKQTIRGANEAISLLERKLQINLDLDKLKSNLSVANHQ